MSTIKEKNLNTEVVVAKVVRTVLSNSRHASAKTKKRGEISGGGKKPWKQKGTGRARVGSSRSPIWRGGGVVFGPTGTQNFTVKASKKEKQIATKAAFEAKKSVTQQLSIPTFSRTKEAAQFLKENKLNGKTLILINFTPAKDEKQPRQIAEIKRVFRNIPAVFVAYLSEVNAYDVLNADAIVMLDLKKAEKKEAVQAPQAKETK